MAQQNLVFDPPAARRSDPVTSHIAEHDHTASGRRASNRDYVRQLVELHPGSTARELAAAARKADLPVWLDNVEITRRLNDLADETVSQIMKNRPIVRGLPRRCRITNRRMLTWWPK